MTLDHSQQAELLHLTRIALLHPNSREWAEWKAREYAQQMPNRWGWLPAALSTALTDSATTASEQSKPLPVQQPEKTARR
jgi:hypothetical protein